MTYPFSKRESVTQKEVVEYIRSIEYPKEDKKTAGNKIRGRIETACKKGLIKKIANDPIRYPTKELFYWARTKWPTLAKVEGIPVRVITGSAAVTAGSATACGSGYLIPQDKEKLKREYCKAQEEIIQLRTFISSLQEINNALEEENKELRPWRDNELKRRKKCGRRSGGGTE